MSSRKKVVKKVKRKPKKRSRASKPIRISKSIPRPPRRNNLRLFTGAGQSGEGIFDDIGEELEKVGKTILKGAKVAGEFIKENKVISRGLTLAAIAAPELAPFATVAGVLGFGANSGSLLVFNQGQPPPSEYNFSKTAYALTGPIVPTQQSLVFI